MKTSLFEFDQPFGPPVELRTLRGQRQGDPGGLSVGRYIPSFEMSSHLSFTASPYLRVFLFYLPSPDLLIPYLGFYTPHSALRNSTRAWTSRIIRFAYLICQGISIYFVHLSTPREMEEDHEGHQVKRARDI
jgi:hypothetical protein